MDKNNDDLGLDLGLGLNDYNNNNKPKKIIDYNSSQNNNKRKSFLDLSIPLHTSDHHHHHGLVTRDGSSSSLKIMGKDVMKQGGSEIGFSVNGSKEDDGDESKYSMDFSCRKKLRLTIDQTTLLEDSFKHQTTLNTAQKHALAEKLNLKPRQVEVWFQNRRARTKLKQTEVDCEFLKRNCERLSEENWRLKKELLDLRSTMKVEKPPQAAAAAGLGQQAQQQIFHHKHAAAQEKNRGGGEKKEAATEVVHVSPH